MFGKQTPNTQITDPFILWPAHFNVMCSNQYCPYINMPKPTPGKYACGDSWCSGTYKISKALAREAEQFFQNEVAIMDKRRWKAALARDARHKPLPSLPNHHHQRRHQPQQRQKPLPRPPSHRREQEQYQQHRRQKDFATANDDRQFRSHIKINRDGLVRRPAQRRAASPPPSLDTPTHPRIERYYAKHGWPQQQGEEKRVPGTAAAQVPDGIHVPFAPTYLGKWKPINSPYPVDIKYVPTKFYECVI